MNADAPAVPKGCYLYAILVDFRLVYLGKGTNGRAWEHEKEARKLNEQRAAGRRIKSTLFYNKLGKAIRSGSVVDVRVIKDGLTDKEAFASERRLIRMIRQLVPLYNQKDGGHGFSSDDARKIWECEEHRRRMSDAAKGRVFSEEHRRKMGESRPNARAVRTPIGIFKSAAEAARAHGIKIATAHWRARNQNKGWSYIGEELRPPKPKPLRLNTRPVITPLGAFHSITAAAVAYGITKPAARMRAREQIKDWHFADEELRPPKPKKRDPRSRKVITPDGISPSMTEAARAWGVSKATAKGWAAFQRRGWRYADCEPMLKNKSRRESRRGWSRAVITPDGCFETISAAAKACKITPGAAAHRAKNQLYGWRFVGCELAQRDKQRRAKNSAVVTPIGHFENIRVAAKAHGIQYQTAHARAKNQTKGWHFVDTKLPLAA